MYQQIDNITVNKVRWESLSETDRKSFNVFMTNKLLSSEEDLIEIVNYVQKHTTLSPENVYTFWIKILPKSKFYLKYPKKSKTKQNQELVSIIASFYQLSTREAAEYLPLIKKEDLKNMLTGMGYKDTKIKTLLK